VRTHPTHPTAYGHVAGLLYATEATSLTATDMRILDSCISTALYKIFGISGSEQFRPWKKQPGRPRKRWVEQVTTSKGLGSFLLMLGVLRRIGQHGGYYDPSTVKRRARERREEKEKRYARVLVLVSTLFEKPKVDVKKVTVVIPEC